MRHADFPYASPDTQATGPAGMPLAVSIFADREHLRDQIRDDAMAAGMAVRECGPVAALHDGEARPIGEVVLVDCPLADAAVLAALSRLDIRAKHSAAHLIVSTSIEALDDVFACCDQSDAQILVDPSRADRIIALGRALTRFSNLRLRELSEEDRGTLLRLIEQVGEIAQRLDQFGVGHAAIFGEGKGLGLESPGSEFAGEKPKAGGRLASGAKPSLPDARTIRRIIRNRHVRTRFFDGALFADPAWDILLDLTAARIEAIRVSVTSLCIASGVPPTTALRWIGQMIEAGLLQRNEDDADRRRAFIALTDRAADMMARYFAEVGKSTAKLT
ncbi:MAG: winged helix DNA-binding protein [Porphyrobacter sp.]|nr:winged helix DNA-binding protein [Porphyrobacter sp.]